MADVSDMGLRKAIQWAKTFARSSNDPHTKVGAALLVMHPDLRYRAVTFGRNRIVDRGDAASFERPTKYPRAIHAEFGAIGRAAELGITTGNGVIYITHPPCVDCCKLILSAGISTVIIGEGCYHSDSAAEREKANFLLRDLRVMREMEVISSLIFD